MENPKVEKKEDLTVDVLKAMLKMKEGELKSDETPSAENICNFKPTKANQVACTEPAHFHYKDRSFCKKHNRTVQALNCKKACDEEEAQEKAKKELEKIQAELKSLKEASLETPKESPPKEAVPKSKGKIAKAIKEEAKNAVKQPSSAKSKTETLKKPAVIKRKIKQNKWGRYEDSETGILFDPQTKAAFGIQDRKNGRILPLNKDAISSCEKYGWKYVSINIVETSEEESSSSENSSENRSEDSSEVLETKVNTKVHTKVQRPVKRQESSEESQEESSGQSQEESSEQSQEESSEQSQDENSGESQDENSGESEEENSGESEEENSGESEEESSNQESSD